MTHLALEDEVLQVIRSMLGNGIGTFGLRDDAAVLGLPAGGPLVASVDSVVEGVHFDLALSTPHDVGWKALTSALSDLAAMGAAPLGALVGLWPAISVFRASALHGTRTTTAALPRVRFALVTVQIAVTVAMLGGATLLLRSLWNLVSVPMGTSSTFAASL